MTDFPSFPDDDGKRIVYVREVRTADLPKEIQARTGGIELLYGIHDADGAVLALATDRKQAFVVARQNEMSPVSVH